MSFGLPLFLLLLLLLPVGLAAYWLVQRRRSKYAVRFTNLDLLANVVDRTPDFRRHLPPVLYGLSLVALVLALARPETVNKIPKEEATVILVTDVSGSMNAEDVDPTRLAAAKKSANDLVAILPGKFQIALVAFASTVRTIVPPTTDRELLAAGIESLTAVGGTAMGDAIVQAVDIGKLPPPNDELEDGATPAPGRDEEQDSEDKHPAVIVLLSDGFNSVGQYLPIDAANIALAENIPVYTVALGTPEGFVDIEQNGIIRRVQVPPDEETLSAIAEITGGKFFKAPSASDLEQVYEDLGSRIGYDEEKEEQTAWFAGAGAALILVAGGLSLAWFGRFP
jgi:Ca-activated chloride channel family protein